MTWMMEQSTPSVFQMIEKSEVSDTPDGCAILQRDFNRLKKWPDRQLMKFKKMN